MSEQTRMRRSKESSREQGRDQHSPAQASQSPSATVEQGIELAPFGTAAVSMGHAFGRLRVTTDGPLPHVQRQPLRTAIQRDEEGLLSPPSLLHPPDPSSRYRLGGDFQLRLDPEIQAMAMRHTELLLDPTLLRLSLSRVNLSSPTPAPALPAINLSVPTTFRDTSAAPNPLALPVLPTPPPLVPAGAGPATPRPGTAGDVLGAIMAIPAVDQAVTSLRTQATGQLSRDWGRLRTGERVGVISALAVVGLGALGGVATDPSARQMLIGQLNGRPLPVPGLSWMRLELNTAGSNLMVGMHVDVGSLLPPSLGFGPSSPTALGAPPTPQPSVLGQRSVQPGAEPAESSQGEQISRRIQAAAGGGSLLDSGARDHLEAGLGADLSRVRIHTDSEADHLARAVSAEAFTSGQDIFFRAGTYNPHSSDGLRLLAHEATHTVQQAAGPVSGTPISGGLSISDPSDSFEQEAEQAAQQVVARVQRTSSPAERRAPFGYRFGELRVLA